IYDLTGRKVFSSTLQLLEGENSIPVQTTLPAGFYLLKAGTTVEKIIIQ
ncbi:MAG: T9SS type A sorting domain-containing protein, partial [Bacteroidales bacterium]|nr:T9SS type A sorting domain-containing protein [Bacteroidales bacterium]